VTPCNVMVGYQRFRGVHPKDGGSVVLRNAGILPQHCTWRHNPEDVDLYWCLVTSHLLYETVFDCVA